MVAPLALVFMTQWMLLITQLCVGWHCTDCVNENFSCVIYNVSLMNCTWQAGRDAPGDTQYFLYWQYSGSDDAMECELYIKDKNGRNIGCRFENVTTEPRWACFLVNGSSNDSQIQFYDQCIKLYKIEKLMPPSNITVSCDESKNDCIIQWQRPQISHSNLDKCFKYEIIIKYKQQRMSETAVFCSKSTPKLL